MARFKLKRLHVHTLAFQAVMSVMEEHDVLNSCTTDGIDGSCTMQPFHDEPLLYLHGTNGTAVLSPRASAARASLAATDWVCGDHTTPSTTKGYSFRVEDVHVILDNEFKEHTSPGIVPLLYLYMSSRCNICIFICICIVGARHIPLADDSPVACFMDQSHRFHTCVAPNLVCFKPRVTIGAGDNISGAALMPIAINSV